METNNEARFDALYREHAVDVLGCCARRTSREDAKDAASEVFVVALRKIDTVPLGEGALPWLYSVAKNVLRNRARSTRRRGRLALKLEGAGDETVEGPEPQVVRHSEHERLIRALEKLSSKDQEILRLVEWEGSQPGNGCRDVLRKRSSNRSADQPYVQATRSHARRSEQYAHSPRANRGRR
jgi:RNA polymerase sigma-70 factor (ECF subfamily)